jgi:hypothetical protein
MIDFDLSVFKVNEEDLPLPKLITSYFSCQEQYDGRMEITLLGGRLILTVHS